MSLMVLVELEGQNLPFQKEKKGKKAKKKERKKNENEVKKWKRKKRNGDAEKQRKGWDIGEMVSVFLEILVYES